MNPLSPACLGFGFGSLAVAMLGLYAPAPAVNVLPMTGGAGGQRRSVGVPISRRGDDDFLLMVLL